MKKNKLNRFIVLSVAFHIILISAVLLYFYKNPLSGGKSGTVMVGVISTGDRAHKQTSSAHSNDSETRKQKSNPKIALEKKPVKQTIKNQKITNQRVQKQLPDNTKKKTELTNQDKSATTSKAPVSNSIYGKETASIGQKGDQENSNSGNLGSNKSLAYPNYSLNPKPKYPRVARKRGYEGEVKLKVFVLADGKVGKIEVLRPSGHKVLDDEAIETVKDWIFVPGKQGGEEISSWVTVPITFQLKSS